VQGRRHAGPYISRSSAGRDRDERRAGAAGQRIHALPVPARESEATTAPIEPCARGRLNRVSRYGVTVVLALEELLATFGSGGDAAVTEATFVIVPFNVGFTTIVTFAVLPPERLPRAQVTIRLSGFTPQLPWVVTADPNPAFFGKLSVSVTPVAAEPLLPTVRV
jgi:hypothetical protein